MTTHVLFTSASVSVQNPVSLSFKEGFVKVFGDQNIIFLDEDEKTVQISLDRSTGSGFISKDPYNYAKFSAAIKLPIGYTAGVVVTFYTANNEKYPNNHDELDFEFLGNVEGENWILQTNVYGNGSMDRGREERYNLSFVSANDFHYYSILWSKNWTIFYLDDVPIRQVPRIEAMGGDYPSKPMSLYATIWDGSGWATSGGEYKINYMYAPYNATYSNLTIDGCSVDPISQSNKCGNGANIVAEFGGLTIEAKEKMKMFRDKNLIYSYCHDSQRYQTPLPECMDTMSI
ncbi:Glyco_hydro_16 domain-containing protein/XET_C domain-containing protein [Cephalotus follicularis]|uniref:Xyloglucan endotransglucosylase/hydrolase n=1 Tax=Cephalotus follicularis TaxID=3775 RepID=A0A1Q3B0B1_CEPFO|nr:Glyco_hydro_16 domain-containing protein/XET_C domain-containing protein [Cephalotus follicularis]